MQVEIIWLEFQWGFGTYDLLAMTTRIFRCPKRLNHISFDNKEECTDGGNGLTGKEKQEEDG